MSGTLEKERAEWATLEERYRHRVATLGDDNLRLQEEHEGAVRTAEQLRRKAAEDDLTLALLRSEAMDAKERIRALELLVEQVSRERDALRFNELAANGSDELEWNSKVRATCDRSHVSRDARWA